MNRNKCSTFVAHPYSYAFGRSDANVLYQTIGDSLRIQCEKNGSKMAVISPHQRLKKSFRELNRDVNCLAKGLSETLGLEAGQVVGLWSANCYEWLVIVYACTRLGLIVCSLSPVLQPLELEYALNKGRVRALFMPGDDSPQDPLVNQFTRVLRETATIKTLVNVITIDTGFGLKDTFKSTSFTTLSALMQNNGEVSQSFVDAVNPDMPSHIIFTSGTTGKPKGALLSHFNLVNNSFFYCSKAGIGGERDKLCLPLLLFHSFGGVHGAITMSVLGVTLVLTGYRYNPRSVLHSLALHNCTHLMAVPTMLIDIGDYAQVHNYRVASLRGVVTGGAPVHPEVCNRFIAGFPSIDSFHIGYGCTELGPSICLTEKDDPQEERLKSVGTPVGLIEIKIVDPKNGKMVKVGEVGELRARGHCVMIGYWDDEAATKEVIDAAGWYSTGDLALMDVKGYFKIVGRTKELIIRGGANIYPREVEEVLLKHPNVSDAYVCGVPDQRLGEEVCAWVSTKNKSEPLSEESVKQFLREKISYYKIPKYVLLVDTFPTTQSGKVQKFEMTRKSVEMLQLNRQKAKL